MDLKQVIGIGVAGNFTGHLEQAGEAKDFVKVKVVDEKAPKGIFPFYTPNSKRFLGEYPISASEIKMAGENTKLQPEPEVALFCELIYQDRKIVNLIPKQFTAFNDCSLRQEAPKISRKKNWGLCSQGASKTFIPIDKFEPGGVMDNYNITCFLKRNGKVFNYGVDSQVSGYSYFYKKLVDWMIDKLNNQKNKGPLENIVELLRASRFPKQALIAIGATRYTNYGEKTYLEVGDIVYVVVYDSRLYKRKAIKSFVEKDNFSTKNMSILRQKVM